MKKGAGQQRLVRAPSIPLCCYELSPLSLPVLNGDILRNLLALINKSPYSFPLLFYRAFSTGECVGKRRRADTGTRQCGV